MAKVETAVGIEGAQVAQEANVEQVNVNVEASVEQAAQVKVKGKPKGKAKAEKPAVEVDAVRFENDGAVVRVHVAKIAANANENFTRPEGVGEIEALAGRIERDGQETPIWVARDTASGDGYFRARAGFRRHAAIHLLHSQGRHDGFVDCRVLADAGQRAAIIANVVENENGKVDISPLGRMTSYAALQEQGYSFAQIATLTHRAEDFVRDHLRLPKAAPECIEALKADPEGEDSLFIPWSVIRLVIRWPKGEQADLLPKVRGLSTPKAAALLAKLKAAKDAPEEVVEEGGEGEGEGEGEPSEKQDKLAAYKLTVAKKLHPVFEALIEATRQLDERLTALEEAVDADDREDYDAAVTLQRLLRKAANKGGDALLALVGEDAWNEVVGSAAGETSDEE